MNRNLIRRSAGWVAGLLMLAHPAIGSDKSNEALEHWTPTELRLIRSLSLSELGPAMPDPSNRFADDDSMARVGRLLFFDPRLSGNREISCASCHRPEQAFTDGVRRSNGMGTTLRNAPTLIGAQYSSWFYWDGRKDSQWSQALAPLLHVDEMGGDLASIAALIRNDPVYRDVFRGELGASDESVLVWVGKAIAAFERRLAPGPSAFDRYAESLAAESSEPVPALDEDQRAGLRLFISPRTQCLRCHNGPLFTNHGFHNVGPPPMESDSIPADRSFVDGFDPGRQFAIAQVAADRFNCLGVHSDAHPEQCAELQFIKREGEELPGAFKVPTLRNVGRTAPYYHQGQFGTLEQVLDHYDNPPRNRLGHQELVGINLTRSQKRQLAAFLRSLDSPLLDPAWGDPPKPAPPTVPEPGTVANPAE